MGILKVAQLDPGFSFNDYWNTFTNLLVQSGWAAPGYPRARSSSWSSGGPLGEQFEDYGFFGGAMLSVRRMEGSSIFADFRLGTNFLPSTASGAPAGTGVYQQATSLNYVNYGAAGFSTAEALYMATVTAPNYRLFTQLHRNNVGYTAAMILQNHIPQWTGVRVGWITSDTAWNALPGQNPWGGIRENGSTQTTGITAYTIERPNVSDVSTLRNRRLGSQALYIRNAQEIVGTLPSDWYAVAANGIPRWATLYTEDNGLKLLYLGNSFGTGMAVKIDNLT